MGGTEGGASGGSLEAPRTRSWKQRWRAACSWFVLGVSAPGVALVVFAVLTRHSSPSMSRAVLLGLAAVAPAAPAQAQDQWLQQAALKAEPVGGTGPVLNLDVSFLSQETDAWHTDAAGLSPARQARIESCYQTAEAAYQGGVWDGGFRGNADGLSTFDQSVSDFYAGQRRKSQFGNCMR